MYLYYILAVYVLILIALYIGYIYIDRDTKKVLIFISYQIDKLGYEFIRNIYLNKENLYDYEKTIEILLDKKNKFIQKKHNSLQDLKDMYHGYQEDIAYLEKLLEKDIIEKQEDKVEESFETLQNLNSIKTNFRIIFAILTLGIGGLIISDKNYS